MKFKNSLLLIALTVPLFTAAQADRAPTDFPELIMTKISGAPVLGKPILITGSNRPIMSQGHGLAAPAFYDMDGDGLKDLLIGEYGSGIEFERYMGNFIRVYPNIGTEDQPGFEGRFDYARPPFQYKVQAHGTPYSVDQFCCLGFTPQFVDLNADGFPDMVTGQYQGEVSWFRGSGDGFIPGEVLQQEGNPRDTDRKSFIKNQTYWLYSSASFGDFTGDGIPDLIVGGAGGLRISKNTGTPTEPTFGSRDLLLDTEGNPLKVYDYSSEEIAELFGRKEPYIAGNAKLSPVVVDWDNDGVLDLLVTNSYHRNGLSGVDFFRGVKVNDEHRFEKRVPLFTTKNGTKALPGSSPHVFVTDYNSDGINDLLIGVSIVTLHNTFSGQLSWQWENDNHLAGAGKDPANIKNLLPANQLDTYWKKVTLPPGIDINDYVTIRHQGYVYVMLGSKSESKPAQVKKPKTK